MAKSGDAVVRAFVERRRCAARNDFTDGDGLYLHGNRIAWYDELGIMWVSMCGWDTVTTRNRLNTVLWMLGVEERFCQRHYDQWFAGQCIDPCAKIPVGPGALGMAAIAAERKLAALALQE